MNLMEMVFERGSHYDLAHVMNKSRNVINLVILRLEQVGDLARHQCRCDAMPPKLPPWKLPSFGQFLKIFNDRRDHRQLADLPHAEIKHCLLDVFYRFG